MRWCRTFACVGLLTLASVSAAQRQVVFILDNSKSMASYDPKGLARLSARLFYALMGTSGRFYISTLTKTVPALQTSPDNLKFYLNSSPNDADQTMFLPPLRDAAAQLKRSAVNGSDVTRAVVLVTDGAIEDTNQSQLKALGQNLSDEGILLYIILFGTKAPTYEPTLKRLFPVSQWSKILSDATGKQLLHLAALVYSEAFGDVIEAPGSVFKTWDFLSEGATQARIVVYHTSQRPPIGAVKDPSGNKMTEHSEEEAGSSFSLYHVNPPSPGPYHVSPPPGATYMVVKTVPSMFEPCDPVTKAPLEANQARAVMAERAEAVCFASTGSVNNVSLMPVWTSGPNAGFRAGQCSPGKRVGSVWLSTCQFDSPGNIEFANLQATASGGVTKREPLRVIPFFQIALKPPRADLESISRNQKRCTPIPFQFTAIQGSLPAGAKVTATVDLQADKDLVSATAQLDGSPLSTDGTPGAPVLLSGKHTFCLMAGNISPDALSAAHSFPVSFFLKSTDFPNDLKVIPNLLITVPIEPPGWLQVWANSALFIAALFGAVLVLVSISGRRFLPDGIQCRSWSLSGGKDHVFPLKPAPLRSILGDRRTILVDNGSYTAGVLRGTVPELFEFIPKRDVNVEGNTLQRTPRGFCLRAHENYTLQSPRGNYGFRIEYF